MNARTTAVLGVVVALLLARLTLFQVGENELAIRTQFGRVVQAGYEPGLHAKWPWDAIHRFERRILTHEFPGEAFLTTEDKPLTVDFFVKWRIKDPVRYYLATRGIEDDAAQRLGDNVKDGIKAAFASRTLQQIVAADPATYSGDMLAHSSNTAQELGVELVDVRIRHIDLQDQVLAAVYQRMAGNFHALASRLRAEGDAEAERIAAAANRQRTELLANAQLDAQNVRGEGDAEAARIYAQAYSRNPEFYAFYRSLQAYRNALVRDGDVLVLTPDGEFFKYLHSAGRH
ncbi:MAG TPA: protease modulator HflC [Steroidobacteraceae bacterium]|nr:protease modulator HflC [Steroidobacteraceae bacterium]